MAYEIKSLCHSVVFHLVYTAIITPTKNRKYPGVSLAFLSPLLMELWDRFIAGSGFDPLCGCFVYQKTKNIYFQIYWLFDRESLNRFLNPTYLDRILFPTPWKMNGWTWKSSAWKGTFSNPRFFGFNMLIGKILFPYPYHPCMVYFSTFGWSLQYM